MNMGRIEGGSKSNVIAGEAFMHWSARLKPGDSNKEFLNEIQACVPQGARVEWEVPFSGHPLPADGQDNEMAKDFCNRAGLSPAQPVDFWTEAALFSAAGLAVMVLGPGDIAQAHVTDEWVALSQLERAFELYSRLVKDHG